MKRLGLIGGTGLEHWGGDGRPVDVSSIYGHPSAKPVEYSIGDLKLFFLSRHGRSHELPPHAVNYRANIDVLRRLEVKHVVAVNAVGSIAPDFQTGGLSVPDQLIDYTWGRAHSYSMSASEELNHIEFASPFDGEMRTRLIRAAEMASLPVTDGGCIGVTQGPRLETAAEIARLKRDGCDLVGMTSMPEASLAREAGIAYATLCVHSNWAAGISEQHITMESIEKTLDQAMTSVRQLLEKLLEEFSNVH
jgi:purine nucleoside phosphorylase